MSTFLLQAVILLLISSSSVLIFAQDSDPTIAIQASGNSFISTLTLNIGRRSFSRNFTLDTTAQIPTSKCSPPNGRKGFRISFTGLRGGSLPTSVNLPVQISCLRGKNTASVLALGSSTSSFPFQVTAAGKLPLKFAYCLGSGDRGQLSFGRQNYFLFKNSDILDARFLSFNRTRLTVSNNPRAGSTTYLIQLQSVRMNSASVKAQELIQIGTKARFTSLPDPAYDFVRQQVIREAARKKIKRESATLNELSLCYRMTPTQLGSFPSVVMEFGSNAAYTIPPSNYMVPTSRSSGIACFGFLKAGAAQAVIGTLQQENYYIEFNEGNKTLGFTEPLLVRYRLGCSQAFGS